MSADEKSLGQASLPSRDRISGSKDELSNLSDHDDPEKGNERPAAAFNPTDWRGPDDPDNPLNWPAWIRYCHVVPPAVISFTAYVIRYTPPRALWARLTDSFKGSGDLDYHTCS
jgi:hypothetical protein